MRRTQRLSEILTALSTHGAVEVTALARGFGVSEATVRRDLDLLERQRLLARTYGGAVASDVMYELPMRYKSARHQAEKIKIAREAATRVADASVVGFTGGTSTTEVARALIDRRGLTVVTNALNIAGELATRSEMKLLLTGGTARPESYELVGPLAERALEGVNLDIAIVGVDGLAPAEGLTTHHEVEAHTNRALLRRADVVVAVADSSKLGLVAFARICALEEIDELITDRSADAMIIDAIQDRGVRVVAV